MASIGRKSWDRTKTGLASKFDGRITVPLADVLDRVVQLQDQVAELSRIVTAQAKVANETTELLGRVLASSSSRLDALEEHLAHHDSHRSAPRAPARSAKSKAPSETTGGPHAPGDPS